MAKSKRLTVTPLASTRAGRLLLAPLSNLGSVAKYRAHSRPAFSIRLSLVKRTASFFAPAFFAPAFFVPSSS